MSRQLLEKLSKENTAILLEIIESIDLPSHELTFAAEYAGHIKDSDVVRKALIPLLNHKDAVVREGVLYGLTNHLNEDVKRQIEKMEKTDESVIIRKICLEILEDDNV